MTSKTMLKKVRRIHRLLKQAQKDLMDDRDEYNGFEHGMDKLVIARQICAKITRNKI